jgi:hypothetical protein
MYLTKIHSFGKLLPVLFLAFFLGKMNPAQGQIVQDSSFEAGVINSGWRDSSLHIEPIICELVTCGDCGGLCGPRTGNFFVYMGGHSGIEKAWVEQDIFIPKADAAHLIFYVWMSKVDAASNSYFSALVDSNSLFTISVSDSMEYMQGYQKVTLDISQYADSAQHLLRFYVYQNNVNTSTNFLLDDVTVQLVMGIEEEEIVLSHVNVYPNPSTGVFHVSFSSMLQHDMSYRVFNSNGQVLINENFQPQNQQLEVNLNQYPAGIYHLQIFHKDQVYYKKLVVQ